MVVRKKPSPRLSEVKSPEPLLSPQPAPCCFLLPKDPRDFSYFLSSSVSLPHLPILCGIFLPTHHLQSLEYMDFLLLLKISQEVLLPKSIAVAYCWTAKLLVSPVLRVIVPVIHEQGSLLSLSVWVTGEWLTLEPQKVLDFPGGTEGTLPFGNQLIWPPPFYPQIPHPLQTWEVLSLRQKNISLPGSQIAGVPDPASGRISERQWA